MCFRVLKRSFLRVPKRSFLRVPKRTPDLYSLTCSSLLCTVSDPSSHSSHTHLRSVLIQGAPGMKDGGVFPLCGMLHIRNKVSALLGWRHMPSSTLVTGLQGESFQATKKLRSSVFRRFLFIFFGKQHVKKFLSLWISNMKISIEKNRKALTGGCDILMKHWLWNTNIDRVFTSTRFKQSLTPLMFNMEPGNEALKKRIPGSFSSWNEIDLWSCSSLKTSG